MTLFKKGTFTSHSGLELHWKIECSALTDEDIETFAMIIRDNFSPYSGVYGIPRGGVRLADAVRKFVSDKGPFLIVDDVLTTGNSMSEAKARFADKVQYGCLGVVLFARGEYVPGWITPIFRLDEGLR